MAKRLIKLPRVSEKTTVPRSGVYAGMADGTFPKCIKIGKRRVAWIEEEIDEWIEARIKGGRP